MSVLAPTGFRGSMHWLWRRSRGGTRFRALLAALLFAAAAAAELAVPLAFGRLVDVVGAGEAGAIWPPIVLAALGVGGGAVAAGIAAIVLASALEPLLGEIRRDAVRAAILLPGRTADQVPPGELVARGTDDIEALREAVGGPIPTVAASVFAVAASAVGLGALHPGFLLAALLALPVQLLALRAYLRRAPALYAGERAATARRSAAVLGAVRAQSAIRAFATADRVRVRIARRSWAVVRAELAIRIVQSRFFLRLDLAEILGTIALLVAGFLLVTSDAVSIGEATAAVLLFTALFAPLSAVILVVDDLQSAAAALGRVVGLVDLSGDGGSPEGAPDADSDAILLRDLRLDLPGHPAVLSDIGLRVPAGQRIGIVGASGAGKTSLARVLAGLIEPDAGTARVHGVDPAALDDGARAALVALVGQEPHLFAGTLRENLLLAAPAASDAELASVLAAVAGEQWSAALPDGLDTVLGEGGAAADAALLHRVALARVALRPSPVVVLDEATAAMDAQEAGSLDAASRTAFAGRTVLVIAHRLSQADACDRVLVLDAGRIVEDGAPAELRSAGGPYARLWQAWSADRSSPPRSPSTVGCSTSVAAHLIDS